MSELIMPDMFDRLKICADEVRERADAYDDLTEAREMARVAVASLVPELRAWKGSHLGIVTDMAFYSLETEAPCDRVIRDEAFYMRGVFANGALREVITQLDETMAISDVELCLRFKPDIRGEVANLVLSESVLVPVVALRDLRVA